MGCFFTAVGGLQTLACDPIRVYSNTTGKGLTGKYSFETLRVLICITYPSTIIKHAIATPWRDIARCCHERTTRRSAIAEIELSREAHPMRGLIAPVRVR